MPGWFFSGFLSKCGIIFYVSYSISGMWYLAISLPFIDNSQNMVKYSFGHHWNLIYEPLFLNLKIDGFVSCYMSTHGYFWISDC